MTRFLSFLIVALCISNLSAQPGSSSGFRISHFCNSRLEKIDTGRDSSLKIRTFALDHGEIQEETFGTSFLRPATGSIYDPNTNNESIQRLVIIYKNDTMIIDFTGICKFMPDGDGGGFMAYRNMDSLVIQRGYFRYFLDKNQWDQPTPGLTPSNKNRLISGGALEYRNSADLSFLTEDKLPVIYFLRHAGHYIQNKQPDSALADIFKGIKKNNGTKNCETLMLLSEAYALKQEYDTAITYATAAINCNNLGGIIYNEGIYRHRINLYIRTGHLDKALLDYDSVVAISGDKQSAEIDRVKFETEYLKNYKDAIERLRDEIDKSQTDALSLYPNPALYFNLAMAEYRSGAEEQAFNDWVKAMEGSYSRQFLTIHFDSLIKQHSGVAQLYLARAIARYNNPDNLHIEQDLTNISNDLNKAEQLDRSDFRINYYRAMAFRGKKMDNRALQEINIAIAKNPDDPRCYLYRYWIKDALKDKSEYEDMTKYKMLIKTWDFKKQR